MANITLSGTLLDPNSGFAARDKIRFTHKTTTGSTLKGSVSTLVIGADGAYSIDLQYGLVLVERRDSTKSQYINLGVVTVNADNPATTLPELLSATVPVSSEELIEFQSILADCVAAQEAAEAAAAEAAQLGSNTGASLVGTSSGATVQQSLDALTAGQIGGVIVFATYALLDAYTPQNATEEKSSFKVTNDSNTALNGYYSWVSGTAYTKDADLANGVVEAGNVDAVSGAVIFSELYRKVPEYLDQTTVISDSILQSMKLIRSLRVLNITDAATWNLKGFGISGSNILFLLKKSTIAGDYVNQSVPLDGGVDEWRLFEYKASGGETVQIVYNPSLAAPLINNKVYYVNNSIYTDSDYIEAREVISENADLISNTLELSTGDYVNKETITNSNVLDAQELKRLIKYVRIDNRYTDYVYNIKGWGQTTGTNCYILVTVDGVSGDYFNNAGTLTIDPLDDTITDFTFTMQNGEILTLGIVQSEIVPLNNNNIVPLNESVYNDNVNRANNYTDEQISVVNGRIDGLGSAESKYMHISFDDFNLALMDLISNELVYNSIFENSFFNTIKGLNNTYGAVFSMYCYNANTSTGFDISNVPNKFKTEFISNSGWLKFGWHGKNELVNLSSMPFAEIQTEYDKFVNAVFFFAGGSRSLDSVPRLSNFVGTEIEVQELLLVNGNIRGLLGSDNDATWSYYLGSVNSNELRKRNIYYDEVNQLNFLNSHKRLESMGSNITAELDAEITNADLCSNMNEMIMFTHEGNSSGMSKLSGAIAWAASNGYKFDYPQNNH